MVVNATNRPEKLHQHFILNNCARKAELKTLGKPSVANISLHVEKTFLFQTNFQRLQKMFSRTEKIQQFIFVLMQLQLLFARSYLNLVIAISKYDFINPVSHLNLM